ncbi:unnamed protein product [Cunninghamella echinulata]
MVIYRDSDLFDDDDNNTNDILTPTPILNNPILVDSPSFATSPLLSSRDLNQSHYFKNDVMCAMEELNYNQKLTGVRPHNPPPNIFNSTLDQYRDGTESTTPDVLWNKKRNYQKRDAPISTGCPNSRRIAFMGAAADCSYVKAYGGIRTAKIQMITDWNVASSVYERTFNISLGLIYMQMSTPQCPQKLTPITNWNQECSDKYTINQRLSDFSFWRGQRGDDQAALWHLMTKCATGSKVGIAWLSQLCETQASQQVEENGSFDWVSGTGVSSITREEWKVVAHEIGHGFGAIHDCSAQLCSCRNGCACCPLSPTNCSAGQTYLMNPTSNVSTNDFSPCSIMDICNSFPNIGYCLKSPGDINNSTFSMCGNGILEHGEQCDPGLTDSPCCYAKNCTLKPEAVCDDYSSQCCLNCGIAPKDTICRPAVSECDTEEVCTGLTSQCPPDVYDGDGTPCANGTMSCASGVCTSRDEQCTARGLRLNISKQCSFQEDSCQISCADPSDPNNCLVLSGMFLDGTECGLAGFCRNGKCVGTGISNTIKKWVEKNKHIAIPVFLFGGLFILALIGLIIWYIIRRYRNNHLLNGKDKNSRPSSVASSRPESIRQGVAGFGNNNNGNNGQNNTNVTDNNNSNSNNNPHHVTTMLHPQRNINERVERTNPFLHNNANNSNIHIDQTNNALVDTSVHSTHSSYASQPNTLTTTTSSARESNIPPSELWELQTFNTNNNNSNSNNIRDLSLSQLQDPYINDNNVAPSLFNGKNVSDPDYSNNNNNNNNNSYDNINSNSDINVTNPFSVSRRHPAFSNHLSNATTTSTAIASNTTIPLKDIMINTKDTGYVDPTIGIATGTHRRTSSNVEYN